jgi:hypothetical protein
MRVSASVRAEPLTPTAVLALEAAAVALVRRLLQLDATHLSRLRGVSGPTFVLICGAAEDLPWVDGVLYLGVDASAPRLLMPTPLCPNVPCALLERAIARRLDGQPYRVSPPWALCFEPQLVIPVGDAKPVTARALEAWRTERAAVAESQ